MRHLDEGTLQAWLDVPRSGLDGAEVAEIERHLAGCEVCSARLAALGRMSRDVGDLLSAPLVDSGDVPAFQDVVTRAGRGGAEGGSRPRPAGPHRWPAAGWAASIVLAAGLGWIANDLLSRSAARAPIVVGETSLPAPEREAAEGSLAVELRRAPLPADPDAADAQPTVTGEVPALTASNEPEVALEDITAAVEAPPLQLPAPEPRALDVPAPESAEVAGRPVTSPPLPEVEVSDLVVGATFESQEAADSASAGSVAPSGVRVAGTVTDDRGRPLPRAQVFVEGTTTGTLADERGRFMFLLDPRAADPVNGELTLFAERLGYATGRRTLTVGDSDSLTADFSLPEVAIALEQIVVTAASDPVQRRLRADSLRPPEAAVEDAAEVPGESSWRTVPWDDVEALAGFAPVRVPGLDLVSVGVSEEAGAAWVRVLQTLEDGSTLELLETLAPAPESAGVDAPRTRIAVKRGDVTVVALARLSEAELREVLERLR